MTLTAGSGLLASGILAHPAAAATTAPFSAGAFSPTGAGWETTTAGAVAPFGGSPSYGSVEGPLNSPVVTIDSTPDGRGYWLAASDGGIFSFGDARFYGSEGGHHLNRPIVAMTATPDGRGYWLVASDGGIFAFGDARFYGSEGAHPLNRPIVAMASTTDGHGYWLVASDGGIFTFGDARFYGSEGAHPLNRPIVGMASTTDGRGYWLAASDGGIFTFGDAPFLGSLGSRALPSPIVAVAAGTGHKGYRLVSADGAYYDFEPGSTPNPVATPGPVTPVTPTVSSTITSTLSTAAGWPTSVFTKPVDDQVRAASSSSGVFSRALVTDYEQNYGAVGVNQLPIWTVGASEPTVTVVVTPGCNNFTSDTGTRIPIPLGATTNSSDDPLVIHQPASHTDWELWQAKPLGNGTWTACWGGKLSTTTSDGVFPVPFGLSGSGISYLATTITQGDVTSGAIRHAIAVDLPRCNAPEVTPANRTDCGSDPGQPTEGTWFRLPTSLAMPGGMTPFAQQVFRTLQTYGMVVTDRAGAVVIQAENAADWQLEGHSGTDPITASWAGKPEYAVLNGIPWSQLQVVQP